MSRADELRAELVLLEKEAEYRERKESGASRDELKAVGLREARQTFRESREGAATASPDVITATAEVPEV